MSVQATTWVWDYSQAEGSARLVLLAIADGANREGKNSCQSASSLAEMCKLSKRTVQTKISELISIGELVKEGVHGQYSTNIYSLPMQNPTLRNSCVRENDVYADDDTTLRKTPPDATQQSAHNPIINPNNSKELYPSSGAQKAHTIKQARSLPEGWMPDPDVVQQMQDELHRMGKQIDLEFEHRKFTDHFNSVGGAKGRKKDWNATWRNWMRTARAENNYKPGWQKRLEHAATQNRTYQQESEQWIYQVEQ